MLRQTVNVTIDLNNATDGITGIEHVQGSDYANNILLGDGGSNILIGGEGYSEHIYYDKTPCGSYGNDTVVSWTADDSLVGGAGNDSPGVWVAMIPGRWT